MAKRAVSKRVKGTPAAGNPSGWSGKALGLVLCAFFAFGMATGLSPAGRAFAARARASLAAYWNQAAATLVQWRPRATRSAILAPIARPVGDAVALVERREGFYELYAAGELRGPVEPSRAGDLPILSGAAVRTAKAPELVSYAATLVRSEVALSGLVSEMRVESDGTAALFLDRSHTELRVELDEAPGELRRAAEVLARWRGRERMIALVDMTTPGQAVMRLRAAPAAALRRVAARAHSGGAARASGGGPR